MTGVIARDRVQVIRCVSLIFAFFVESWLCDIYEAFFIEWCGTFKVVVAFWTNANFNVIRNYFTFELLTMIV